MPFTQYNDISAFDLSTLHLNDIRWLVGTGQRMSTRQGKKQKPHTGEAFSPLLAMFDWMSGMS